MMHNTGTGFFDFFSKMITIFKVYNVLACNVNCTANTNLSDSITEFSEDLEKQSLNGIVLFNGDYSLIHNMYNRFVFKFEIGSSSFVVKVTEYCARDEENNIAVTELNHDNIIKTLGTFVTKNNIYVKHKIKQSSSTIIDNSIQNDIEEINCFGKFYFEIMKYLDTKLVYEYTRTEKEILVILYDILKGIYYLHEDMIVHSDLKLENILGITENNKITYKIIDFDFSMKLDFKEETKSNQYFGTYFYQAPELFFKGDLSLKSDIYSFGAICFFMYNKEIYLEKIYVEISSMHLKVCKKCTKKDVYDFLNSECDSYPEEICDKCKDCIECSLNISCILCDLCENCKNDQCNHDPNFNRLYKFQKFLYYSILNLQRSNNEEINDKIVKEMQQTSVVVAAENKTKMNDNVKEMMQSCLKDNNERPDIQNLLLSQNLQAAFEGLFFIDDFPGLIK